MRYKNKMSIQQTSSSVCEDEKQRPLVNKEDQQQNVNETAIKIINTTVVRRPECRTRQNTSSTIVEAVEYATKLSWEELHPTTRALLVGNMEDKVELSMLK